MNFKLSNKLILPLIIIVKTPIKQDINPKNLILFIFSLNKKYEIKYIKIDEEV